MEDMRKIFLITILLALSFYLPCGAEDLPKIVYTTHEVNIHTLPNFDGELVLSTKIGLALEVLKKDGQWYRVKINNAKSGWVSLGWVTDNVDEIKNVIAKNKEKLSKNKEKIAELEAEVKPIPASNISENLIIYKKLLSLDPNNPKYRKKVEHYSSKLELEVKKQKAQSDLELLNWQWWDEHGYVTAEGEVKNISGKKMGRVQAVVTWYDSNDQMITYDSSFVEYNPIMPGQTSPFKVMGRYNPAMKKASLNFKYYTGSIIPTYPGYPYNWQ